MNAEPEMPGWLASLGHVYSRPGYRKRYPAASANMNDAARRQDSEPKPVALLLIAATCILSGAFIGASTNAVNGVVSPLYFTNIMRWDDVQDVWRATIAQGIFEGLIYGILFSVVFTLVVGIVSKARCPFRLAWRHLLLIIVAVYCCWAIGGAIAMGLATLSPDFYRNAFIGVPDTYGPMMRYAWVGGSIWGAMIGGLLSIVIGSIMFATRWNAQGERIAG